MHQPLSRQTEHQQASRLSYAGNGCGNHQLYDDYDNIDGELYDSNSRSSGELADTELEPNQRHCSRHFTLSPETTDYDSNCGDLDSLSNDLNGCIGNVGSMTGVGLSSSCAIVPDYSRLYTSMPVLEDGLSSGHASDTENNNPNPPSSILTNNLLDSKFSNNLTTIDMNISTSAAATVNVTQNNDLHLVDVIKDATEAMAKDIDLNKIDNFGIGLIDLKQPDDNRMDSKNSYLDSNISSIFSTGKRCFGGIRSFFIRVLIQLTILQFPIFADIAHAALKDIRSTLQQTKSLKNQQCQSPSIADDDTKHTKNDRNTNNTSPVWLPRQNQQRSHSHESLNSDDPSKPLSLDDEEADTDLETDRLLGQQRLDDQGFYDEKVQMAADEGRTTKLHTDTYPDLFQTPKWNDRSRIKSSSKSQAQQLAQTFSSASIRRGIGSTMSGGAASGCAATSSSINSNAAVSPPLAQKNVSTSLDTNDGSENNSCLTSPNKMMPQKSPTASLNSKNDNDKKCSGKSRNKEGKECRPIIC